MTKTSPRSSTHYRTRAVRDRYSYKATFEEIEANGFNLNIPRYVDTFEPEPEVDLQAVQNEIRDLEKQLAQTREKRTSTSRSSVSMSDDEDGKERTEAN